jgi:HTH-type transcriptional regulator, global nitrogen regulator NrpRI
MPAEIPEDCFMDIDTQRRIAAILRIISEASTSLGSSRIAEELKLQGFDFKDRMVRYYLEETDKLGFTENLGRHGRRITALGRDELMRAVAIDRVGFVSATVDEFAYKTTFDMRTRSGTVILNLSTIKRDEFDKAREIMRQVMGAGLGMGRFLTVAEAGQPIAGLQTPDDCVTVGTVCGITLNGVLRANGIPIASRFGGLLEIKEKKPVRFTQIIHYDGTTIDPIEIFIKGKMTRAYDAAITGRGTIGASFREIPAVALSEAKQIISELERVGICGVLALGEAGRPLLDVPVPQGRVGAIVAAGLNPVAAVEEQGIPTENFAMSTLCDFSELSPVL